MSDAPATRLDLDALIAEARAMRTDAPRGDMVAIARELAAALAAERARADQAERERDVLIRQKRLAPHDPWCPYPANGGRCHPTCWQSEPAWPASAWPAAPTAEQL